MIHLSITNWAQAKNQVAPIRLQVFVEEQGVPVDMEWDEFDQDAWHAIAKFNDQVVGTGRLILPTNDRIQTAKIGRMAVLKNHRCQGIGQQILRALIQKGKEKGAQAFILHAQTHAIPFYAAEGFEPNGPIFDETGIPHVEMRLVI
jgi:predicted GNAT family N-acyltransferase